jgi:hypothetical protein
MMKTSLGPGTESNASTSTSQATAKIQAPKNYQLNQNFRIWLERFNNFVQLAKIPASQRRVQLLSRLDHQA